MEAPEKEEGEGFEDFTLASPWERLVDGVEKALKQWQEPETKIQAQAGEVPQPSAQLDFGGQRLTLTYHIRTGQPSEGRKSSPWSKESHPVQLWFGVDEFLTFGPTEGRPDQALVGLLLSTAAVASGNVENTLPVFIPVSDGDDVAYKGIAVRTSSGFVCYLDTERTVRKGPHPELSSLMELLQARTRLLGASPDPANLCVSMRHTYETPRLPGTDAASQGLGREQIEEDEGFWDDSMPWSAWHNLDDPVLGFRLTASWPLMRAASLKEVRSIEVKAPDSAEEWRLEAVFDESHAGAVTLEGEASGFASRLRALSIAYLCTLGTHFMDDFAHMNLTERNEMWMLRRSFNVPGSLFQIPPPTAIVRSVQTLFDEDPREASSEKPRNSHLPCKAAPPGSLFGRFCMQAQRSPRIQAVAALWTQFVQEVRWFWEEAEPLPHVAAQGPPDLACCLVHQKLQMLAACIERRAADPDFRRKSAKSGRSPEEPPMEPVAEGEPFDEAEQKRTEAKRVDDWNSAPGWEDADFDAGCEGHLDPRTAQDFGRFAGQDKAAALEAERLEEIASESSTQYDSCSDTETLEMAPPGRRVSPLRPSKGSEDASAPVRRAFEQRKGDQQRGGSEPGEDMEGREGSLGPVRDLWLVKVKRRIHEPLTQEPPYMTEDMLQEQETALAALSTFDQGKDALARLHSRMLSSDMSAFKAANPGSVLEDFVRWHSPRDWLPEDDRGTSPSHLDRESVPGSMSPGHLDGEDVPGSWPPRGHLSQRMQADSFWGELWARAECLPVTDQRPLFDHTREAEKVLHYLDMIEPQELLAQVLACAVCSALHLLSAAFGASESLVAQLRTSVGSEASSALDLTRLQQAGKGDSEALQSSLGSLCDRFEQLEALTVKAASLGQKLPGRLDLKRQLLATEAGRASAVIDLATLGERGTMGEIAEVAALFSKAKAQNRSLIGSPPKNAWFPIGQVPSVVEYVLEQGLEESPAAGEAELINRAYVRSTQGELLAATAFWKPPWPRTL